MAKAKRRDARQYLRETQPEVWQTAQDMARHLASEMKGLPWPEKSFMLDQFIRELVEELMGPEGLNEIASLPIAEMVPEDDASSADAGQLVASICSVFTAALHDLDDEEFDGLLKIDGPQKALLLLISEVQDHQDAARSWIATEGADKVTEALLPLLGITVLLIADRAGGNSIEQLTTVEKLKASLSGWGEELS